MSNGKMTIHKLSDDTKVFLRELVETFSDAIRYSSDDNDKVAKAIDRFNNLIEDNIGRFGRHRTY
jgi:HSP90 family molecular chaperone